MSFVWDEELRLFRREGYVSLPYSDGAEAERRLYDVVRNASDRSTLSAELAASISDWPSEYHLSRSRHCLLRPLAIAPGDSVLELGCGCGAITRYLGEIGADVVAVEGSLLRARIAAERCRDLSNVQIFADDLLTFETERKFDWVLLIGVLEYAAAFSAEQDGALHYLDSTRRFLSPAGKLVVALENKLGLKYFNGCGEDHTGIPFSGVQDLYRPRTVRTFGRRELTRLLSAAGLSHTYFHYPFPDYKLPAVVISDDGLTDGGFDPVDLLVRCQARDYSGSPYRAFDEALVFPSLHDNGLLADLSNSFLVVATAGPEPASNTKELAFAFSPRRAAEFATQTRFVRCGSEIRVLKEHLTSAAAPVVVLEDRLTLRNQLSAAAYQPGRQLLWNLLKARASSGGLEEVVQSLTPWITFLLQHAHVPTAQIGDSFGRSSKLATYLLPGDLVDCTPFNLLETGGKLVSIDLEWRSDSDIPMGWVVTRGVLWALPCGVPAADTLRSVTAVIEALCQASGLSVLPSEIQTWLELEGSFQRVVLGYPSQGVITQQTSSGMRLALNEIQTLQQSVSSLGAEVAGLNGALAGRDKQIAEANRAVLTRDGQIANLNEMLVRRDEQIAGLDQTIAQLTSARDGVRAELGELRIQAEQLELSLLEGSSQLSGVLSSRSWKLTAPLRSVKERMGAFGLARVRQKRQMRRDKHLVAASKAFDPNWYLLQNADVAKAGVDPVDHYVRFGGLEGRDPSPLFSSKKYLQQYPDVLAAGMNPLVHYLRFGAAEGRQVSVVQEPITEHDDVFAYMAMPIQPSALPRQVAIGVSSQGNFFMAEIARMIEDAFRQLGVQTRLFDDHDATNLARDEVVIIVAPHEFFTLGEGPNLLEAFKKAPMLVMFNTEQQQTQWFAVADRYLKSATAVLDINYESARYLAQAGYRSWFLPLGYSDYIVRSFNGMLPEHELFKYMPASVLNPEPLSYSERPIDILFVGTSSHRRSEFLANNAAFFANKNTFLYMPVGDTPFLPDSSRTLDFATLVALVRRSKILLNVHRDSSPYLEWQRIVTLGILQKTLVVSDHCQQAPCVEANLDYLDGPLEGLPALCELALSNIATTEAITQRAYDRLKSNYPMAQVVGRCFTALAKTIGGG